MPLKKRFTYHPPKEGQVERYQAIRDKAYEFALFIEQEVLPSDERDQAILKLEECVMHANAGIARNE